MSLKAGLSWGVVGATANPASPDARRPKANSYKIPKIYEMPRNSHYNSLMRKYLQSLLQRKACAQPYWRTAAVLTNGSLLQDK